jgi:hypothetical protein
MGIQTTDVNAPIEDLQAEMRRVCLIYRVKPATCQTGVDETHDCGTRKGR